MKIKVEAFPFRDGTAGGIVTIVFDDCFKINSVHLKRSVNGNPYLSFPSRLVEKDEENGVLRKDYAHPLTEQFREKLTALAIKSYNEKILKEGRADLL